LPEAATWQIAVTLKGIGAAADRIEESILMRGFNI
jgi:hypothetical protein